MNSPCLFLIKVQRGEEGWNNCSQAGAKSASGRSILRLHLILHLAPGWPPAFVQHSGFTAKHSRVVAAPYFNLSIGCPQSLWFGPIRPENEAAICTCRSKIVQQWNCCIILPFEQSRIRPGWATRQSIYLSNLPRKRFAPLRSNGATNQLKKGTGFQKIKVWLKLSSQIHLLSAK